MKIETTVGSFKKIINALDDALGVYEDWEQTEARTVLGILETSLQNYLCHLEEKENICNLDL